MIDTHSHLLPGLDHGCPDMQTALLMAEKSAASGVTLVICTPHLYEWNPTLVRQARETVVKMRKVLVSRGVPLELRLGFEVDLSVVAPAGKKNLETLAVEGTSGVLILETPYQDWPSHLERLVRRLSLGGFVPVLAHPERNERVQEDPSVLVPCLEAGAVVQGTAGSIGGEFGEKPKRALFALLAGGLVSLLASDAHAFRQEGWTMVPMLAILRSVVSEEDLALMTETNPARLLAGQPLLRLPARPVPRGGGRKAKD